MCVGLSDEDLDRSQPVERKTVSVSQRFATYRSWNARGFQKCADLLRVDLTIRHKYTPCLLRHRGTPTSVQSSRSPGFTPTQVYREAVSVLVPDNRQ